jgi:hypothetical protein
MGGTVRYMLLICGDDEAHKEMEDDGSFVASCHAWADEMQQSGGHATGRPQGWRWWSNYRPPGSWPATTCCPLPAPICSAGMRRPSPTREALELASTDAERRYLTRRLTEPTSS